MDTRVAVMAIIIEEPDAVEKLNTTLHSVSEYIIGRMGIPYREKGINIVSIAIDAPQDLISALAGKLGNIPNVSVKIRASPAAPRAYSNPSQISMARSCRPVIPTAWSTASSL